MKVTWKDILVEFEHIDQKQLTEDWLWLIGNNMKPIAISSIGDMFLADKSGEIFWLNVGEGKFEFAAKNYKDLKEKMNDDKTANNWFMFDLVNEIKESGLKLTEGKLFSYIKLPIIGGHYSAENFRICDIAAHFSFAGQIHRQIKDHPDGTSVKIEFEK